MRAEYDSDADALSITLEEGARAEFGDEVHARAVVAVSGRHPVEVQVLYPTDGLEEPLAAAAAKYPLDLEALEAAARSALSAPDRVVKVDVITPAS